MDYWTRRIASVFLCGLVLIAKVQPSFSQRISAGVIAGVPLTPALNTENDGTSTFSNTISPNTRRYTFGPTIAVDGLPFNLGIEFDVLYKHLNIDTAILMVDILPPDINGVRGLLQSFINAGYAYDKWEFPVLATYRPPKSSAFGIQTFALGGMSWNRVHQTKVAGVSGSREARFGQSFSGPFVLTPFAPSVAFLEKDTTAGIVLGGGMDWRLRIIHLTPQLRYTRWLHRNFNFLCPGQPSSVCSNLNQVEILLGVTF
jgi:hypothetical protein